MKENNQKYIIRCDRSGVFFGEIKERNGQEVTVKNVRQLWSWAGANSTMQIAKDGVASPNSCKFTVMLDEIQVLDAIELLPCTDKAVASIEGVPEWKI